MSEIHGNCIKMLKPNDSAAKEKAEFFGNRIAKDRQKWMPAIEAAEYLGISEASLRNRVYRGFLNVYKPWGRKGRSYFKRNELDLLMENSRI